MLSFHHIQAFWAFTILPFLVLIYWLDKRRRKALRIKIGSPAQTDKLTSNYSPLNDWLKFLFPLLSLVCIIIAWSGPRRTDKSKLSLNKGVDVMIAWDLSKSMYAEDIRPNRLELSRQLVYSLIDALPSDRIGLVFFAGHAYMQMPLSMDHGVARLYVQQASPEQLPTQGTVLGEALAMCQNAFVKEERKQKAIVLISDGEGHDEKTSDWINALKESGITVHTVGVGTATGAPIPEKTTGSFKKDSEGAIIQSRLDPASLKELAKGTEGKYFELKNTNETVRLLKTQIDRMEKNNAPDPSLADHKEYFQWFIATGLICLLAGSLWPERKKSKRP